MAIYDFVFEKGNYSLANVKSIITQAGYPTAGPGVTYEPRTRGYAVTSTTTMSLTTLRNAATALKINNVEISSPPDLSKLSAPSRKAKLSQVEVGDPDATPYTVTIDLNVNNDGTYNQLISNGYKLVAFKCVESTLSKQGAAVVWFTETALAPSVVINWTETYFAYTSATDIVAGGTVVEGSVKPVATNQMVQVTANQTLTVGDNGPAGSIAINNTTSTQLTAGLAQLVPGSSPPTTSPTCAFPLFGNNTIEMTPVVKIVLVFVTGTVDAGTVFEAAFSNGLMIDLTGASSRDVAYQLNGGWSPTNASWTKIIPSGEEMTPLIISPI